MEKSDIPSLEDLTSLIKEHKETEKLVSEAEELASQYNSKAYELEDQIDNAVNLVFEDLGFSFYKHANWSYTHFSSSYFVYDLAIDKLAVALFESPNKVLYWEIDKDNEKEFWNVRYIQDMEKMPKKWERMSRKRLNKIQSKYTSQTRKLSSIINQYNKRKG